MSAIAATASSALVAASSGLEQIRVRRIISYLNTKTRDDLKKLLPKGVARDKTIKDLPNVRYPTGILGVLPADSAYASLGNIAETILSLPSGQINLENLLIVIAQEYPGLSDQDRTKITKSVTTSHFLERLVATRQQLEASFKGKPEYEPTVARDHVQGHPDIRTPTQVYECKLTGQVAENWIDFCFQAFAYAAILPEVQQVNIVLPLQTLVWSFDVTPKAWPQREAYFALLEHLAVEYQTVAASNAAAAEIICQHHGIGRHIAKAPGAFLKSIQHITDGSKAWQLFLSSNMSARISIKDAEIPPVAEHIQRTGAKIYIHTPYVINLCTPGCEADNYNVTCLSELARIAAAMKCRGTVVHVGKSTTHPVAEAMENMRTNLKAAARNATPECPILLETPAGQGTETLTDREEFYRFVHELADPRIQVCVDTCHVFACGHDPVDYLKYGIERYPGLIKLVHYNDSLVEKGAKVDRHAFMGAGKIGLPTMEQIAQTASAANIPCVIEI